jgi:hypothetical protein
MAAYYRQHLSLYSGSERAVKSQHREKAIKDITLVTKKIVFMVSTFR